MERKLGHMPFKNLGDMLEEARIRKLNADIEKTVAELTNGKKPPFSDLTEGTLHEFNEALSKRSDTKLISEFE